MVSAKPGEIYREKYCMFDIESAPCTGSDCVVEMTAPPDTLPCGIHEVCDLFFNRDNSSRSNFGFPLTLLACVVSLFFWSINLPCLTQIEQIWFLISILSLWTPLNKHEYSFQSKSIRLIRFWHETKRWNKPFFNPLKKTRIGLIGYFYPFVG